MEGNSQEHEDAAGRGPRATSETLDCLIGLALNSGATDARVIGTELIILDPRVRLKCSVPRCSSYDAHLLCPPNIMPVNEFEKILRRYEKAIIVQIETDVDSSDRGDRTLSGDTCQALDVATSARDWQLKLHKLINILETAAFKRGLYLAAGFIGGECRMCDECVNPHSGQQCRHPFEARPSMEAMGIDVLKTCKDAGLPLHLSSQSKVRWTGLVLLE